MAALSGYVNWMASRYDDIRSAMPAELRALRDRASESGQHRRTPDIVANLAYGFNVFLAFALDVGAITDAERETLRAHAWTALGKVAQAQSDHHTAADPVHRFIELLRTAIASGHAHIAFRDGSIPPPFDAWGWRERISSNGDSETKEIIPRGDLVGWTSGEDLFLDPNAAYRVAQEVASSTGDSLSIGPRTIAKRMHERGLLLSTNDQRGKLTVRHTLQGSRRDVLHVRSAALVETATAGNDTAGNDTENAVGSENTNTKLGARQSVGPE